MSLCVSVPYPADQVVWLPAGPQRSTLVSENPRPKRIHWPPWGARGLHLLPGVAPLSVKSIRIHPAVNC